MNKGILHITTRNAWQTALGSGIYTHESLASEGFIHCSECYQVSNVANYLFRGQQNLVLLRIDTQKLASELKYEALGHLEAFPHIYGPLNLEAVIEVVDFPPDHQGYFHLPAGLS